MFQIDLDPPHPVAAFCNAMYGHEYASDFYTPAALFVRANCSLRPILPGDTAPWPDFNALLAHARNHADSDVEEALYLAISKYPAAATPNPFPARILPPPPPTNQINGLVDYLYGRESQADPIGAVARFVRRHVKIRPAAGSPSRWTDLTALKFHAGNAGPTVTSAQIDSAVAAAGV